MAAEVSSTKLTFCGVCSRIGGIGWEVRTYSIQDSSDAKASVSQILRAKLKRSI
jgi:hypothetical protein